MKNTFILPDSIYEINQTIELVTPIKEISSFQSIYYIAMITLAIANVCLVFIIFRRNISSNETNIEKNRRVSLLKTLILDYNMKEFYSFFKAVNLESKKLQEKNMLDEQKSIINEKLTDLATDFRQDFTDIFIAIDKTLYQQILSKTDNLIDGLTETIFDEGINLAHQPKYEELISKPLNNSKTEVIRILFSYSGR